METTIKEVFESDNWIITEVKQFLNNTVRVNAKRRFKKADESSFFSKICSIKYAYKLAAKNYGKKVSKLNSFKY